MSQAEGQLQENRRRVGMNNLQTVWQHLLSIQVISDLDGKFLTSSLEMTRLVHLQAS